MFSFEIFHLDWPLVAYHLSHLLFAYLLALPIGWEREQSKRHFGLRTFPLVAVVTCGFMLVGKSVIDTTDGEARIFQGIITGIVAITTGGITFIRFLRRYPVDPTSKEAKTTHGTF